MRLGTLLKTGGAFCAVVMAALFLQTATPGAPALVAPAMAQDAGTVPGETRGNTSDTQFWQEIRRGQSGTVSIPDKQAGVLIQSEGENWRAVRNGPVSTYGSWLLLGMIGLLALYFVLRGRIPISGGKSGETMERFTGIERFGHWLTASSFIVLAITGLNMLYGRYVLMPIMPAELFTQITIAGKYAHNFGSVAFALGVVLIFFLWVRHNIPSATDIQWILKGGGLLFPGVHPDSKKFNAGQKVIFWLTVLGGFSVTMSGMALLFPNVEFGMWQKTFGVLAAIGFDVPTQVTQMEELQLSQVWHTIVSLVMIAIVIAHIYIGSVGMQGAFAAMGSGQVDKNWAREHHNLWVAEQLGEPAHGKTAAGDD